MGRGEFPLGKCRIEIILGFHIFRSNFGIVLIFKESWFLVGILDFLKY